MTRPQYSSFHTDRLPFPFQKSFRRFQPEQCGQPRVVANDRMYAWLRAEADNADPARAAAEVNAKMAKALARAKGAAGVDVTTSGYSSYQVTEKNQPTRWRVTQSLSLDGSDFAIRSTAIALRIGLIGLRSSCDSTARNSSFARLAPSAAALASSACR